ncbi:bifunctional 3-dehydroquinate dehydratase/shikimate dehydrogenase, chloroplastic-like isoform X3 [Pyrus communis]|uniref:bifunctional 3-dehydroquinate dehydratase/shikimate dehydrogenase, chloroplastic-like isoform X3 n=1 Tax=Pyrus communis TaxID=23211 RepID=UPI0035BFEE40
MDSPQNVLLASDGLQVGVDGVRRSSTVICAPIMAESVDKMVIDMGKAKALGADLVEVRLDHLKDFNCNEDLKILIKESPLPTLVTYRPKWEGGQYDGDEKYRLDALRLAMELGADFIDVELQVPTIGLVMGEKGLISRILCAKFGGFLTFGSLDSGIVSAPGQPTIKNILHLYNFRQIGPDTKVFGIIGKPVSHSKSPMLYNEAFKSVCFNGVYVHLLVDDIAKFLHTYSSKDFAGFSVTIPHKEAALECCDEVDPVAKAIGAINCIIRRPTDGKLFGFNTDYVGAISAIEDGLKGSHNSVSLTGSPLAGRLFVVIGAGGAGKALAYGAKQKGARIAIANRTYDRARELADTIGGDALSLADLDNFHPEDGMILANTTSIGMQPKVDETPISKHALRSYSLVFDAVYTPKMTRLLKDAKESGAIVVSGLEMFIGQAYEQFERFTGLPAPVELFRRVMDGSS